MASYRRARRPLSALALLALALSLAACPGFHHSPTEPSHGDEVVTLAVGTEVHLRPFTSISLDRIVSDSRCPIGATCVWEGEVAVALTLRSDGRTTPFVLSDHARRATAGPCDVELLSVRPVPVVNEPITAGQYRVTVRVRFLEGR